MIDEQAGTVTFATTFGGLPVKVSITEAQPSSVTLARDVHRRLRVHRRSEDPVGDHISDDVVGLHGPHPVLLGDADICAVVTPYLLDP